MQVSHAPTESDKVVLIEISPFLPCTGPALFKWSTDRALLENGPFEFRLQTTLHPNIDDLLEVNWDDRWRAEVPRYDTFYTLAKGYADVQQARVAAAAESASASLMRTRSAAASFALAVAAIATARSSPVLAQAAAVGALSSLALALYSTTVVSASTRAAQTAAAPAVSRPHLMFFYGTLKRNFHWNKKFLGQVRIHTSSPCCRDTPKGIRTHRCSQITSQMAALYAYRLTGVVAQAEFVCAAMTDLPIPLVVGESGVPYLLGDLPGQGKCVRGELWRLDDTTLLGLDEYEGTPCCWVIR